MEFNLSKKQIAAISGGCLFVVFCVTRNSRFLTSRRYFRRMEKAVKNGVEEAIKEVKGIG